MTLSKRLSPPLWARILAIVVGALVAAQLVTLVLTVFFPPEPSRQYSLADISAALRGSTVREHERPLVLSFEDGAPSLQSPGWVVSAPATRDLAKLVGAAEADVRLLFYAPPPLVGAPLPPPPHAEASRSRFSLRTPQVGQAGGAAGPGGPPPGGMIQGSPGARPGVGGRMPPSGANFPAGSFPGSRLPTARAPSSQPPFVRSPSANPFPSPMGSSPARMPANVPSGAGRPDPGRMPAPSQPFSGPPRGPIIRSPLDAAVFARPIVRSTPPPVETTAGAPPPVPAPVAQAPAVEPPVTTPARIEPVHPTVDPELTTIPRTAPAAATPPPAHAVTERTLDPPSVATGFRLGQAPYVEGEFVAAMRMTDGRWATVRPRPEGFLNSWQRRVLLWFGLSVALITPLALFVAWRLAAPLKIFAESADRLGREPSADLPPLTGPAEIGKAADAFNLMQQRLKRYVEDRTGMIRAISHDLRTPLTRIRFKLERASPSLREAIGRDMDQMEEMIASVLSFMRDEANIAPRQIVDLRSLVEVVVDDALGPAELEPGPAVLVEIDVVGVQRVVENLVDNAVKYGGRAKVSLAVQNGEAFVAVADEGPGLPSDELDQVFKPFYRSAAARASGRSGVGLGLSVSRATIRAHGGDLSLRAGEPGLVAELRLPQAAPARMAA